MSTDFVVRPRVGQPAVCGLFMVTDGNLDDSKLLFCFDVSETLSPLLVISRIGEELGRGEMVESDWSVSRCESLQRIARNRLEQVKELDKERGELWKKSEALRKDFEELKARCSTYHNCAVDNRARVEELEAKVESLSRRGWFGRS